MSLYGIKNILSNYDMSGVKALPLTSFWCNDYLQNMSEFLFNSPVDNNKYFGGSFSELFLKNIFGAENDSNIAPFQLNQPVGSTNFQDSNVSQLYNSLGLQKEGLSYAVFAVAMKGYKNLNDKGNGMLGIVDPNSKKYYLIDINKAEFVGKTDVKFGSGNMNTVAAANKSGSHATLSGFQKVAEEYNGKWDGGAKRIDGLESGINNNSRSKATVIHSTTKNSTWGCIGYTPVYKNGKVDAAATNEKMNKLFPKNTILFTYPTNLDEYSRLSTLV